MSRINFTEEDNDLDTFCQLEEALREEEKIEDYTDFLQGSLANEFPDSFVNPNGETVNPEKIAEKKERNDFHETFVELQQHLADVKRREADLLRDENWIRSERKELAKERKKLEADRILVKERLNNTELADLRERYEQQELQHEQERKKWEKEKEALINKIAQLEKRVRPKVTFATADYHKASKTTNDLVIEEPRPSSIISEGIPKDIEVDQIIEQPQEKEEQEEHEEQEEETIKEKEEVIVEHPPKLEPDVETVVTSTPANKKRKPKVYRITSHENYSLDFDYNPGAIFKEENKRDGRRVVRFKDGSQGTVFRNGTRKIKRSGTIYIFYSNGDACIEYQDGAVGYKYKETQAIELTLPDKSILYIFKNGQKEKHYVTGDKEIQFPNGVYKVIYANGDYVVHHPDGKAERCINGASSVSYEYQD